MYHNVLLHTCCIALFCHISSPPQTFLTYSKYTLNVAYGLRVKERCSQSGGGGGNCFYCCQNSNFQEANNYKCVTFSPVLKNHALLYSLVNLFQFLNMWLIGINPLFIFLQSMKLIFKRTLKYKACQSHQGADGKICGVLFNAALTTLF